MSSTSSPEPPQPGTGRAAQAEPGSAVHPTYGRVAIVQSNYIPWKGYFDLIASVDRFVLFDSAKFSWGQWRNRNQIKTPQGLQWLTVPIRHRGADQTIDQTEIAKPGWAGKHWKTLIQNYRRAPHFDAYHDRFAEAYERVAEERQLSQVNHLLLRVVMDILGIHTPITFSEEEELPANATARVVRLCQRENAVEYVSGPTARNYLDEVQLRRADIKLTYANYEGYPDYPQLYGPFEHAVTILDLLFNVGGDARRYMKARV